MGKKICVLFIDWERSSHALLTMFSHYVSFTPMSRRVLLGCAPAYDAKFPFTIQPEWQCWEPDVEWVRQPPQDR